MNSVITKKSSSRAVLTLKKSIGPETQIEQETLIDLKTTDTSPQSKKDAVLPTAITKVETEHNFDSIYNELHSKFPDIINLTKPALLAVRIRKEISKTGISGVILRKWIGKYFRKSKYYDLHQEGAVRYSLNGEEAGIVTEKHCEKMAKSFEKKAKEKPKEGNKENDLNHSM